MQPSIFCTIGTDRGPVYAPGSFRQRDAYEADYKDSERNKTNDMYQQ